MRGQGFSFKDPQAEFLGSVFDVDPNDIPVGVEVNDYPINDFP
jgi:hypothetical protein